MKDDDFDAARGILLAVGISLAFWAVLIFGAVLWAS